MSVKGFIVAIWILLVSMATILILNFATIKSQLTTLQKSLDLYTDETYQHYRTIEYYLHDLTTEQEQPDAAL